MCNFKRIYCQLSKLGIVLFALTGCDKWYTTDDVSHISHIPQITVNGGNFISLIRSDTAEYIDQGAYATVNGEVLQVSAFGVVDLSEAGVYLIRYMARNSDGIVSQAERYVAVTYNNVSQRDLSGVYTGTTWDTVEMNVTKIHEKGLYASDDIMGYYNMKVPGRFVDIGNFELVLLPGNSEFGRYAAGDGGYTRSSISWTITFIDPPNAGESFQIIWRRKEE